ncbi:carbon-nitrogen hydrolase family protein [Brevibacillus sp. B_LB10_24]|uniref:carbon-nitrogen hydrolase family protein n=1 Tax=Brevibacillus sp. B_LB10_24 TaxID=3380645 RepID=UPI0038BA211D
MSTIMAAAVQMNSQSDKGSNLHQAEKLIREAAAKGATYICLPEYFNFIGPVEEEERNAEEIPAGETVQFLSRLTTELGIWLHGGSILEKAEGTEKYYNTTLLFDPKGEIVSRYRKIHLFDAQIEDGYMESRTKNFGREIAVHRASFATVGLTICHDIRYPELYRLLALQGAEIITVPAAFPMYTGKDHWEVLLRARAIENQAYVIAPGQIGDNHDMSCYGRSMIIDPWGNVIASASDLETTVLAAIDTGFIQEVRRKIPSLHNRRPEVYSLEIREGSDPAK